MNAEREVDERDVKWERERLDFRLELRDAGRVTAFDLDGATMEEARVWAESKGSRFSLGIRSRDSRGELGVLWLVKSDTD